VVQTLMPRLWRFRYQLSMSTKFLEELKIPLITDKTNLAHNLKTRT
jgi:hypothetical protein